jgi:hypothetical protein
MSGRGRLPERDADSFQLVVLVLFGIDHDSIANLQVLQRRVSGALHVEWFKSRCEVVPLQELASGPMLIGT